MKKFLTVIAAAALAAALVGCDDGKSSGGGGGGASMDPDVIGTWDQMASDGTVAIASNLVITADDVTLGGTSYSLAGSYKFIMDGGNGYYDYDYAGIADSYVWDYTVSGTNLYMITELTSATSTVTATSGAVMIFKKH